MCRLVFRCYCVLLIAVLSPPWLRADDPVFSGPQVGEPLTAFQVVSVHDPAAGVEVDPAAGVQVDPVEVAGGKPTLLVFVHQLTRPSMALTRALTSYAKGQSDKGAVGAIVWLDDDKAAAEAYLTRARKSLNFAVPVGISVDGGEGPGAYGLNRHVELTILIANENKVTANFALVQPSVTEAAKIAGELAKLIDQQPPTQAELEKLAFPGNAAARGQSRATARGMERGMTPGANADAASADDLRTMMRQVIAPGLSETELQAAAKAIDQWAGTNQQRQANLKRMATAVLERGMGSEAAQSILQNWKDKSGVSSTDASPATGSATEPGNPPSERQ